MLRLIIADDEKIIRETIRNIIDWEALDIQVIGLCQNGIEAYDMILDEYPDIVLTDIEMPGLSGLELISRVTQSSKNTQFIILSGYGDFVFTKEAMRYGVKHYLLKPCNENEIIEVIEQVKKICYQNRAKLHQQEQNFLMLQKLHESLGHNIIVKSLSDNPDFETLAQQYEWFLSFSNVSYEVCCIHGVSEEQRETFISVLQGYHETHAPAIPLYIVCVSNALFATFEAYDYDYTLLDDLLEKQVEKMGDRVNYKRVSYTNLNTLLPKVGETLHKYEEICLIQNQQRVYINNRNASRQKAEQFLEEMRVTTVESYPGVVQKLSEQLEELSEIESLKSLAVHIFLNLPFKYTNGGISQSSLVSVVEINECTDSQEIRENLISKLRILNPDDWQTVYTGTDFIDKTIAYVHENISDPELSLKEISENHLFMNVDYVSKKFLKVVGCKFSAFLAKARVEKAKQLLADTKNNTVASVAVEVGCGNNPQYFSFLFKKQTGMTPTEFIRQTGGK